MAYWILFLILFSIFSYPLAAWIVVKCSRGRDPTINLKEKEEKEIEEAIEDESDDGVDYSWLETLENEEEG